MPFLIAQSSAMLLSFLPNGLKSARAAFSIGLRPLLVNNPLLQDKLQFPRFEQSRLCTLINHSSSWQHSHCLDPRSNHSIETGGLPLPGAHQLCVWKWNTWEMQKNTFLQTPAAGRRIVSDTRVQFQQDQIHFLVVHQTQLAVYETKRLERVNQWVPNTSSAARITDATLSCDSQLVFVSFVDASVCVFSAANLQPQCFTPSAYLPAYERMSSEVYPLAIAAHPSRTNQFALGLTNGGVHVIEPRESDGKWEYENASAEVEGPINVMFEKMQGRGGGSNSNQQINIEE